MYCYGEGATNCPEFSRTLVKRYMEQPVEGAEQRPNGMGRYIESYLEALWVPKYYPVAELLLY